MTSAQEARADGWQRDTAQRNATITGLARENRQLREQLAAKGHAMNAEPVPDTGAFAEPASMAERRDHITEINQARRDGAQAERERIRRVVNFTLQADPDSTFEQSMLKAIRNWSRRQQGEETAGE